MKLGFNPNFVSWIASYLSLRSCRVLFNDTLSYDFDTTSGVPQGSHLGPIFFILYINDLPLIFKNSECKIYAEDVKIYKSINRILDAKQLQDDLFAFQKWCSDNYLFLNTDKCKVINFTRGNNSFINSYKLNDALLINVNSTLDLGVYIDKKLNFKQHIDYIINRANSIIECYLFVRAGIFRILSVLGKCLML